MSDLFYGEIVTKQPKYKSRKKEKQDSVLISKLCSFQTWEREDLIEFKEKW